MIFLPVKPLGHFEHDHEGKSKWVKYCRPEFDGVLFYDMKHKYCRPEFDGVLFYEMKQKYFVSDMKYFVIMDFFFSYTTYLVEKLLFYALHKTKVSPRSVLYMKR